MFLEAMILEDPLRFESEIIEMLKCGKSNEVNRIIKQFTSKYSNEVAFLRVMGHYSLFTRNFDSAMRYYNQALNVNSNDAYSRVWWCYLTYKTDRIYDVEPYLSVLKSHESVMAQVVLAQYYLKKADYTSALPYAKKAYESDPEDVDVVLSYAQVLLFKRENDALVLDVLEHIVKKMPHEDLESLYIKTLFMTEAFEKCEKECKKIMVKSPNSKSAELARNTIKKIKDRQKPQRQNDPQKSAQPKVTSDAVKTKDLDEAISKLDRLIGLDGVKDQINKLNKKISYDKLRAEKLGIPMENNSGYHFVFSGNPGTGKTTVARLMADIFYHLGLIETGQLIETDRSGLVGQFIGQTAILTKEKIEEAQGGVLFIDEAYALARGGDNSNDFGPEAIDTLIKAVEDKRDKFIVILAGYKDEMYKLLKMNPGLESRFNKFIEFPDYSDDELLEIARQMAWEKHYKLDESACAAFLEKINKEKVDEKFGNARVVRNLMNEAFEEKANRYELDDFDEDALEYLSAIDFGVDLKQTTEEKVDVYLEELNQLIGLRNVKQKVNEVIRFVQYQLESVELGHAKQVPYMHMVFSGNPGTGKTTVASLVAKIFKALGILKKGHFVPVVRADLVSGYIGQTAIKTTNKIKQAYGGILFIDEAYALSQGGSNDFGKEAIDTLIKEMEDHRDKLMVILAGYTEDMRQLLMTNPGFESRISFNIEFEDYSVDELMAIFDRLCQKEGYTYTDDFKRSLEHDLSELIEDKDEHFGNAREVRKIFEQLKMKIAVRVIENHVSANLRNVFVSEDLA